MTEELSYHDKYVFAKKIVEQVSEEAGVTGWRSHTLEGIESAG